MEMFSGYFMTIKPYILLFLCFYRVCFASIYIFSAILKIPTRVFLMPVRGAGYTFYPLSINRVGFFLSINREKNSAVSVRFYAYLFLVMNKLIKTQNS